MKKKDSEKKKAAKKKKKAQSPELDQLKKLTGTVKEMAKELKKLKKANKSLKSDLKKIKKKKKKKKEKKPEIVTTTVESQVLPPTKPAAKSKETTKVTRAAKAKPGPKPKGKPGPKPKATRRPATPERPASPEDLKFIQGLGAKMESLLNQEGVKTFTDLARATQAKVKGVLEQSGPRLKNKDPKPFIEQAKLVKAEKWSELAALQEELMKGKKKPGPKGGNT